MDKAKIFIIIGAVILLTGSITYSIIGFQDAIKNNTFGKKAKAVDDGFGNFIDGVIDFFDVDWFDWGLSDSSNNPDALFPNHILVLFMMGCGVMAFLHMFK